jgi:cobyrinic acid a,c-diamide synthase
MVTEILCPALFLVAPASGQGKTTITAAIARYHRLQGREVRIFKMGPDYLDPQILEQASGHPVTQLEWWMAGEAYCRQQFYDAAKTADLILVEGAMGMYDGEPSSADLAVRFGIPMAIVMNVKAMAQTAAALATGLANYRADVDVVGLIANHCASARHLQLIEDALPAELPLLASFANNPEISLPERHLGLVQANEISEELEQRFNAAAQCVSATALAELPRGVPFYSQQLAPPPQLLSGLKLGVAKDEAFSFIYPANTQLLERMGAELHYFSPIHDSALPSVNALWLPGGYPELHAQALADNTAMHAQLQAFFQSGRPIVAECGGFMYCLSKLRDLAGNIYPMLGLLPGEAVMRERGGCQGMQTAILPSGEMRGHAHHRSLASVDIEPVAFGKRPAHSAPGEAIYCDKGLTASYIHLFFPSAPHLAAQLFTGENS